MSEEKLVERGVPAPVLRCSAGPDGTFTGTYTATLTYSVV